MTITVKITEETKKAMDEFYKDLVRPKTPQYALFQADDGDTVVTLYESGKAVFQGKDADLASQYWIETEKINAGTVHYTNSDEKGKKEKKEIKKDMKLYNATTIGSDEVGTGDYFGPIVVTASYVDKEHMSLLNSLGVRDSKKITDDKIMKIAPQIIREVPHVTYILDNKTYNQNNHNMNKVKAILHNKVLCELAKKPNLRYDYIVVDQFCTPRNYFTYISGAKEKITKITFTTKAEDKCLSVAASSIISRYIFIKEFSKLGDTVNTFLKKGAGHEVDEIGAKIVQKYGFNKLEDIAKLNFKNTDKIKELLNNK